MARRTNHPLKTLFLLGLVALIGWAGYEYIYVRGLFKSESTSVDMMEQREAIREAIFDVFEYDVCLVSVDEISYRANQHHYRIRITVSHECTTQARGMCEEIARASDKVVDESIGVFAYDKAGNLLAKFVE